MKIQREVYDDLVTLAEAGMASTATLQLIEECKSAHPEWREVQQSSPELPSADAPAAVEREALARTQKLLKQKTWLMFFGIAFCLSPMTFVFRDNEMVFLLHRDQPVIAGALYVLGLTCWAAFVWTNRRLTLAGLARGNERAARLAWIFGAIGVFIPAAIMISARSGHREPLGSFVAMALVGFLAALWVGRVTRYGG